MKFLGYCPFLNIGSVHVGRSNNRKVVLTFFLFVRGKCIAGFDTKTLPTLLSENVGVEIASLPRKSLRIKLIQRG